MSTRKRTPGDKHGPLYRGYFAKCKRCGEVVVHVESTGQPMHMHMHRRSKKCKDKVAAR